MTDQKFLSSRAQTTLETLNQCYDRVADKRKLRFTEDKFEIVGIVFIVSFAALFVGLVSTPILDVYKDIGILGLLLIAIILFKTKVSSRQNSQAFVSALAAFSVSQNEISS